MVKRLITSFFLCLVFYTCSSSKSYKNEYDNSTYSSDFELSCENRLFFRKYADILSVSPESLYINPYGFIDDWMHTPYKWGGTDKSGIDCSAFIRRLFNDVYDLKLPRTSFEYRLIQTNA